VFKRPLALLGLTLVASLLPGTAEGLYAPHDGVVSANPADQTPNILDGKVTAILPVGDRIVVGGTFTRVQEVGPGKPVLDRRGLFAFSASTGAVDPNFAPSFGVDPDPAVDKAVEALAPSPDGAIFVAGSATYVGGNTDKVVKLNAATGALAPGFRVAVAAAVKDIAVNGNRLFLAGIFDQVNQQSRGGLAAVDAGTGVLDGGLNVPFTVPRKGVQPRVETIAVSPDGATLVAAGNFMVAGGQPRPQIAMLNVAARPAVVENWHTARYDDTAAPCSEPTFDSFMRDIDMAPDGSYFAVVTTGGYARNGLCDTAARWDTGARGANLEPRWWDRSGGDSYTAVVATGSAVYVGGHLRWLNNNRPNGTYEDATPGPGAVPREGIAALDPLSGLPLTWNPGRVRGEGVWAFASTPTGLWVGSDTDLIGGEVHGKISFFPLAGGAGNPMVGTAATSGDLYAISPNGALSRRSFDGKVVANGASLAGGSDWARVRGAFAVGDKLWTGLDDGTLAVRTISPAGISAPSTVPLYDTPASQFPVTRLTGMFYDNGRLYHTVTGDSRLFYRWFAPESGVVGYEVFVAAEGAGIDFRGVRGMTLVNHELAYAKAGTLRTMDWNGTTPVPGTEAVVANSAGFDWTSLGLFMLDGQFAPPALPGNPAPIAGPGYWMVGSDGNVYSHGGAGDFGDLAGTRLNKPIVALAPTPTGRGYWLTGTDGGIFAFGDATFLGSTGSIKLNKPIVAMAATPTGKGYWLTATDGGIFAFGDAGFYGSTGSMKLNKPILGMAPTPTGKGYWLVASDGGIFAFGDAEFFGSTGSITLNKPIVGMASSPSGAGYWLTASDGGIFAFGDAEFFGSTGSITLNKPIVGMAPARAGTGYWLVASDGGIFSFGDAPFLGSSAGHATAPIIGFQASR
jgi:hypothetical protein